MEIGPIFPNTTVEPTIRAIEMTWDACAPAKTAPIYPPIRRAIRRNTTKAKPIKPKQTSAARSNDTPAKMKNKIMKGSLMSSIS